MSHFDSTSGGGAWLAPRPLIAGVLAGLVACSIAGRVAAGLTHFDDFSRFFLFIQPQTGYYPTISQIVQTARSTAPPEKVLVVVGGNSIFRGTGQNPDELWTIALQRRLGNEFFVLNVAIDQAAITSFGGVVFRTLSRIYKKTIFVALGDHRGASPIDGDQPYRYLFWDAYYKGLLSADDMSLARSVRDAELATNEGQEEHIGAWLDSCLFFRDLWSAIGYRLFFTIWSNNTPSTPFLARRNYRDAGGDVKLIQESTQRDESKNALILNMLSQMTSSLYPIYALGGTTIRESYERAFTQRVRSQVLIVDLAPNPMYLNWLPQPVRQRDSEIGNRYVAMLGELGFHAIEVGRGFDRSDYIDHGHLMASGGERLATEVSTQVRRIAEELGYAGRQSAVSGP